jgi:hypothetical protein
MSFTLQFHPSSRLPEHSDLSREAEDRLQADPCGNEWTDASTAKTGAATSKTLRTASVPPRGGDHDNPHQTEPSAPTRPHVGTPLLRGGSQANSTPSALLTGEMPAPLAPPPSADCASLYGLLHHQRPDRFVSSVFWRVLFPHARFLGFPIILLLPGICAPDLVFLARVGRVRTIAQYDAEEAVLRRSHRRSSFLRGKLRLRVSSRRVRHLVVALLAQAR